MKKYILLGLSTLFMFSASTQIVRNKKKEKIKKMEHFSVVGDIVYYDMVPFAKYQAKTYSLDGGELVEEYNLLLTDNKLQNKQLIGDLIDYISDRHQGAEVEVEIEGKNSMFDL